MKQLSVLILLLSFNLLLIKSSSSIHHSCNRFLESSKDKACSNLPKDYEGNKQFNSLQEYVQSLNLKTSSGKEFLLSLLVDAKITKLSDFLIEIWVYILMLVLAFIALIAWPIMCFCCFCHCGVFSDNKTKGFYGRVILIITLVFLAVIVLSSIVGLSQSEKFVEYFNGSICSLYTFLDNAVTGEKSKDVPRWGGAKGIKESFQVALNSIAELKSVAVIQLPSDNTKKLDSDYIQLIKEVKDNTYQVQSPFMYQQMIPIYGPQFTDITDETSFISMIQKEKKDVIDTSIQALTRLGNVINSIRKNTTLERKIKGVQLLLSTFQSLVEAVSNVVVKSIGILQTAFADIILLIFKILYGIFIIVSCGTFAILFIYTYCRFYGLKKIMHIFWNILFLFTVISFIIGFLFGILGVIGLQTIPVLNYIFSVEYLNSPDSPFGSAEGAEYLNTCINGDGDLARVLGIDSKTDPTAELNTLIELSISIDKIQSSLEIVSDSKTLPLIQKQMNNYIKDIDSTSPEYQKVINEINQDLKECSVNQKYFVSDQAHKTEDIEINSKSPTEYPICQPSGKEQMQKRIETIKQSIDENLNKIKQVNLIDMNASYKSLLTSIQNDLNEAHKLTNDFTDTFAHIIGGNSMFTMFNCKFIRYDMINFVDQFGMKFSSTSQTIGICCLICSFGSFIGVFFLITTILYYSEIARNNKVNNIDIGYNNDKPEIDSNNNTNKELSLPQKNDNNYFPMQ